VSTRYQGASQCRVSLVWMRRAMQTLRMRFGTESGPWLVCFFFGPESSTASSNSTIDSSCAHQLD